MAKLVVIGNAAVDKVDGGDPRPGGCPSFAALALRLLGSDGAIITRYAAADRELFEPFLASLSVPVVVLKARTTCAFGLRYTGEEREMTIDTLGESWTEEDVGLVGPDVVWAHVAPLARSDFPPATLAALAANGIRVSYDGQGLVRVPVVGPLRTDARFDRRLLAHLRALKLADEEAVIVAGGRFHLGVAEDLGVPEILHTIGSRGSIVFEPGRATQVPAAWPVLGVQTTGAGDVFMVAYGAARAEGAAPVEAARAASELVARVLEDRKHRE